MTMKKVLPITLILIGAALLITAVVFWIDSGTSTEPQSFGKTLLEWTTLIVGLGASIKGWMDLFKKDQPLSSQSNTNGGININSEVKSVTGSIAGRDIIQTYVLEDSMYNVEGLPNPYLGLQAFTYNERDRYAGREKLINEAKQRIVSPDYQCNLLFVTGPSGSGKSSFAQAGLLPALISYYEQIGFRVHHRVFRPSRNPKTRLDDALVKLGLNEIQILIIDQFEELFTHSIPGQREDLVDYLNNLQPFHKSRRIFIATLRSDYLGEMHDKMEGLWVIAKDGIPVRAMRKQEIKDAIQRPLSVRFPNGNKRFERELVEKLADDTIEVTFLPLLQVTLEALWNRGELKLSSYDTLTDAIKERADTVWMYHDFDKTHPTLRRTKDEQDEILELLLTLVNVSLDDDIKRDVRINRRFVDFTTKQKAILKELSSARLISIRDEDGEEYVSLIHETLIRNWDVLRDTITARRIQLQKRVRFETQLRLWLSFNRIDDYLLSKGQISEAQELQNIGDIAISPTEAQDFINKSIDKIDAYKKRERLLLKSTESIWSLSSRLDKDTLLNKILESAVTLLEGDSGLILLVDDQTGELTVSAATEPFASEFLGEHLDLELGFAGRVVSTREPIIQNKIQDSVSGVETEQSIELRFHSLLAVPLQVKDHLLGVIEVGNRREGYAFSDDDKEILVAFVNQALIALRNVENVRELSIANMVAGMGAWSAEITHDVNREVGYIRRDIFMLRRKFEDLPRDAKEILERIDQSAGRLALPSLSVLRPEEMKETEKGTNLDAVIALAVDQISVQYPEIVLTRDFKCAELQVAINDRWLRTLFRHLMRNAARAVQASDIKRILIRTSHSENIARVEIEDSGQGVRPELIPLLFQIPIKHEGSLQQGQGLILSRFLVEQYGGKIGLAWSRPGVGACFYFTVPILLKEA